MADTVKTTWLYPVNWDGSYFGGEGGGWPTPGDNPPHGWKRMKVQFTNLSDGTGESSVIKLDRSAFFGVQGLPCTKIGIQRIKFNTYGMSVQLEWDMNPTQLITILPESQEGCLEGPYYPFIDTEGSTDYGPSETGDLLLTTIGHTANDSYNITMDITIKE